MNTLLLIGALAAVPELIRDGWFLPEYANDVRGDAKAVRIP